MSTPTATPYPSRLWLYFQETHGMVLTASEESDIRHAANAAAESDIRTLETELARLRAEVERLTVACDNFSNAEIAEGDWKARAERAEAERDALAKDKARLDWLSVSDAWFDYPATGAFTPDTIRAAIDAAMKGTP